jgi:hypothetical protein
MEIETSDLLVRYLRTLSDDTPRNRILWTIALFVGDDSRTREMLLEAPTFDTDLLEEIAGLASPIELAEFLGLSPTLPADCFSRLFQRVVRTTTDVRALRELGSAAACYWNWHPGAIEVPRELAERLLDAPDEDARLVGLKVLRRYYPEPSALYLRIMQALSSRSSSERCGGTYELTQCLDDAQHRFLLALTSEQIPRLRTIIGELSQNDSDHCVRSNAQNCQRLFGYFDDECALKRQPQ